MPNMKVFHFSLKQKGSDPSAKEKRNTMPFLTSQCKFVSQILTWSLLLLELAADYGMTLVPVGVSGLDTETAPSHCMNNCKNLPKAVQEEC